MVINEKGKIANLISSRPLLIMLPYAGGNSYSYAKIIKLVQSDFDILCPELPGRCALSDEILIRDLHQLVKHVFLNWIKPLNLKRRYIIFGHSMGALIAYLLIQQLVDANLQLPIHLIVSGREGPMFVDDEKPYYSLPSPEFRKKIMEYGGISESVLEDMEIMSYIEPILRADFEAVETYQPKPMALIDIPITVLHGSEEDIKLESLLLWEKVSKGSVKIKEMNGNHFFIFENIRPISSYLVSLIK